MFGGRGIKRRSVSVLKLRLTFDPEVVGVSLHGSFVSEDDGAPQLAQRGSVPETYRKHHLTQCPHYS